MTEELKPCPFCGGKAKIVNIGDCDGSDFYMIVCTKCTTSTSFGFKSRTKLDVIKAWNRRTKKVNKNKYHTQNY